MPQFNLDLSTTLSLVNFQKQDLVPHHFRRNRAKCKLIYFSRLLFSLARKKSFLVAQNNALHFSRRIFNFSFSPLKTFSTFLLSFDRSNTCRYECLQKEILLLHIIPDTYS